MSWPTGSPGEWIIAIFMILIAECELSAESTWTAPEGHWTTLTVKFTLYQESVSNQGAIKFFPASEKNMKEAIFSWISFGSVPWFYSVEDLYIEKISFKWQILLDLTVTVYWQL